MSRTESERAKAATNADEKRDVLLATLASTPEVRLLNSVWAARGVQSTYAAAGLRLLHQVPPDAVTTSIADENAIFPWELELLANERLAVPIGALFQDIAPEQWSQLAVFTKLVRYIENEEFGAYHNESDIIDHLFSIGGRQFDWQQGFLTKQELFRSVYVYGQGRCADHFYNKYNVTVNTFTSTCFAYFVIFSSHPQAFSDIDLSLIDVSPRDRNIVLTIVSQHLQQAKRKAREQRDRAGELAFQPSVLRTHPLIGVSAKSYRLVCPLPDLLMHRMTFGLFYDVIDGGGPIRDEIGKRFEEYVELNVNTFLPEVVVSSEISYKTTKGEIKSPDILLSRDGTMIEALLECKASRLPHSARFALFNIEERGYRDMVKGVKQIWRFVSDARRGIVQNRIANDAVGAIVTLDSWFVAAPNRQEAVLKEAKSQCEKSFPHVSKSDMIPISFVYMPEFERVLAYGDTDLIFKTLKDTSNKSKRGYSFDSFPDDMSARAKDFQKFPFDRLLGNVLPWWNKIEQMHQEKRSDT